MVIKPTKMTSTSNEKKKKWYYYLAWLAIIVTTLRVISDHLRSVEIPEKDDD